MFETLCSPTTSKGNIHHIHHASQQNSFFLWNRHVACHHKLVASFVICGGSFLSGCLAGEGKMIDSLMAVNQVERLGPKFPSASKWTSHKSRHRLEIGGPELYSTEPYVDAKSFASCSNNLRKLEGTRALSKPFYAKFFQSYLFFYVTCQLLQLSSKRPSWPTDWADGKKVWQNSYQVSNMSSIYCKSLSIWEPALVWDPEPLRLRKTKSLHFKHLSSPG